MAHSIVTDVCEGVADCVDACPVACIDQGRGKNKKGTDYYWINFDTCIDCGICLQVCPVRGPSSENVLTSRRCAEFTHGRLMYGDLHCRRG